MATFSEPIVKNVTNEELMNCIRNYRVIYDNKIPQQKKKAWIEISKIFGIGVEEVQTRYKSIRTKFSKYVTPIKCTRSGAGRSDLPEIREDYEHLRWLITHFKYMESVSNFKLKNGETICGKEAEDVDSSGPDCGTKHNGTDDEEGESDSNYDCNEDNDIIYGSFKEIVGELANKPEDEETSSTLEEPSSTPGSNRSSSVISSLGQTPDVELPRKKEKKLHNVIPTAPTLLSTINNK